MLDINSLFLFSSLLNNLLSVLLRFVDCCCSVFLCIVIYPEQCLRHNRCSINIIHTFFFLQFLLKYIFSPGFFSLLWPIKILFPTLHSVYNWADIIHNSGLHHICNLKTMSTSTALSKY